MVPVPASSHARAHVERSHAAFALTALALLLGSCSHAAADGKASAGDLKRREPARVRVAPVEQREMTKTLSTTTVVESEREVGVISRAAGPVMEVRVEPGDVVEEGAVLAVLDQREMKAMLDEAKILVTEAQDAVETAAIAHREAIARVERTKLSWEQAVRDHERNAKGDLISQQALDQLRLNRDTAAAEHETAKLTVERAVVDEKSAATKLEKSKLSLSRVELEFSYTHITAPISGVITSRQIGVGDIVSPSSQSFTKSGQPFVVTDLDNLRARFHRPQRELAMFQGTYLPHDGAAGGGTVQNGDSARGAAQDEPSAARRERPASGAGSVEIRGTAEALPGRKLSGEIILVSPSIDAQSGSFEVWVRLKLLPEESAPLAADAARAPQRLLPGMLVRLEIVTDRHPQALVVPKRSLKREGETSLLFVVRDGVARRVRVEEGFSDETSVEAIPVAPATLAVGEQVIVVGNRDLEEASEVTVDGAAAPTATNEPTPEASGVPTEPSQG